jgi:hypothetical protein
MKSQDSSINTLEAIHRIKQEIDTLSEQQSEALKTATYVGMTAEQAREYDARRQQITNLLEELRLLKIAQ